MLVVEDWHDQPSVRRPTAVTGKLLDHAGWFTPQNIKENEKARNPGEEREEM
jgi:hypothetical protein